MPSSKGISSLILGGELRDLNPQVSLAVDSVGFRFYTDMVVESTLA